MQEVQALIEAAVVASYNEKITVELSRPDEQFGDFATNVALQLSKKLGKNPREVADTIVSALPKDSVIAKAEVAGPGFINLTLSDGAILDSITNKPQKTLQNKEVVAEYSDPNPFKVLHAGHLYTTITGDVIASLLEHAGATVHRLNYGGDVGRHVGIAMWAIVKNLGGEHPEKLESVDPDTRADWLSQRYVEGNEAFESDDTAQAEITDMNAKIYQIHADNDHDSPLAQIYWTCRQWSYDGFDQLYKKLRITPFEKYVPESEVTPKGLEIVNRGLSEGVFEKSDGAVVFKGEEFDLHTRVFVNSNGLPTYEAKDLGLAATKWQDYHFDLNVIITANDIIQYMQVVLKALEHFYPEVAKRSRHLTHGMIKLPGGTKMSSRKGNILRASDILDAAIEANKRVSGGSGDEQAALAAVKYELLKQRIGGDIIYNPEESVSMEGNSGPYIQYAHARACSILAKANNDPKKPKNLEAGERSLARKMGEYSEVIDRASRELMPHHICTYLYELAQTFNRFYEKNRVVDDARETERLYLVKAYADTLKNGLGLLGINAPEHM